MTKGMHNYIQHVNTWWWGKTITLVSKDGYSTVELQFDDSMPNLVVIKGLMVFTTRQREGYGTEMINICEHIAKKEEAKFLQLSVNKEHVLLVNWYERLGFTIVQIDEHEYTMLKVLDSPQKHWKPAWSEDDEKQARQIERIVHNDGCTQKLQKQIADWLKSLKERVQPKPKQEWSEEDILMKGEIVNVLQKNGYYNEEINWLKSLRPHNHWKPSEEQIKVCKEVYADILSAKGFDLGTVNSELNRLEEELKKLAK